MDFYCFRVNKLKELMDSQQEGWIWITFVGGSFPAFTNPIWYAIEQEKLRLSQIYCFVNRSKHILDNYHQFTKFIVPLTQTYGIPTPKITKIDFEETDFPTLEEKIKELLLDLQDQSNIALDMTPGRKYMSALLLFHGSRVKRENPNIKRMYYLHLADFSYQNFQLPLIPFPVLKLYDFFNIKKMSKERSKLDIKPSSDEEISFSIPRSDLILLLNTLWIEDQKMGTIKCKFWPTPLLDFVFKGEKLKISRLISKKAFNNGRKAFLEKILDFVAKNEGLETLKDFESKIEVEVPKYQDFLNIFSMSSVCTEDQEALFEEIFTSIEHNTKTGAKAFYLCLDTNVLIERFYSCLKEKLEEKNSKRIKNHLFPYQVGFFIPPTVEKELSRGGNAKNNQKIAKMFERMKILNLFNQPTKKARLFHGGSLELKKLRHNERVLERSDILSKKTGDDAILDEIDDFSVHNRPKLFVVSNDDTFITATITRRHDPLKWEKRRILPDEILISWDHFCHILYELSQLFGSISLKSSSKVELEGFWSGKDYRERERMEIKVKVFSGRLNNLFRRFQKPLTAFKTI